MKYILIIALAFSPVANAGTRECSVVADVFKMVALLRDLSVKRENVWQETQDYGLPAEITKQKIDAVAALVYKNRHLSVDEVHTNAFKACMNGN